MRVLKWTGRALVLVLAAAALLLAFGWLRTQQGLARTYVVADPPLQVARDAVTLERGAHLFATRGCGHCHGEDASGQEVFDAGPVVRIVAPNITTGGRLKDSTPEQVAGAIRHGVAASGRPLVFMPSAEWQEMSDTDVAALIAFMQQLPPSDHQPPPLEVRPVGRVMWLVGDFPLLPAQDIDHTPRARVAPPAGPTAEYGKYMAQGCKGCHGQDYAGQHVPGTRGVFPDARNITPAGLGSWKEADFERAMRTGVRPDGSKLDPFMPWQTYAQLSDVEMKAIWAFLRTLPPVESKKK